MAWDINQVLLIGRLVQDPEIRYSRSGLPYCNLGLASSRKSSKENAEVEVSYFDIIAFGKIAEICGQYLSKGKQIGVQGYLQQRRWEDSNTGQKRSKVEVIAERIQFLSPSDGAKPKQTIAKGSSDQSDKSKNVNMDSLNESFDDVPF